MQQAAPTVQSLWKKWQKDRDQQAGNDLVEYYMPLVNYQVRRIAAHLPKSVSKEEVYSLGLFGLVDALEKFESDRDLKFDTYASFRIRGSIIDGLRKEDWLPRTIREKVKKIEAASLKLEQQLTRKPFPSEIATEVGLSLTEVEEIIKDSLFANVLSIEEMTSTDNNESNKEGIGYLLKDKKTKGPDEVVLLKERVKELGEAIKRLNEKEQLVISLFYQNELTLTEIGEVLNLSTSRISQIHSRAIVKLKDLLS